MLLRLFHCLLVVAQHCLSLCVLQSAYDPAPGWLSVLYGPGPRHDSWTCSAVSSTVIAAQDNTVG